MVKKSMKKVLAIDIGASSGRFIVVSYEKNKGFSYCETYRFLNGMKMMNNHLRWDFNELIKEIHIGLFKTFASHKDISSLGIDTWGVDYGLLDEKNNLVELPIGYRDDRCRISAENFLLSHDYSSVYFKSGIQFLNFNTFFQLRDDIIRGVDFKTFLMIPDLINYCLTDKKFIELTNLSTTAFYNPINKAIDKDIIKLINLDYNKIPNIIMSSSKIGTISDNISKALKIPQIDVVSVGSHDTASAVASINLDSETAFISSGTWSLLGLELNDPLINEETYHANFTNEIGLEHTVRFLKNIMGLFIIQELKKDFARENPDITFGDIHKQALEVDDNSIYIDVNDEIFQTPGNMLNKYYKYLKKTEQFDGNLTVGEIARSIYESMAFKYLEEFENLKKITNRSINKIIIVGGGTKASLLNQLIANCLNVNVQVGLGEATVFGNALAQFIYLKEFQNLKEARLELSKYYSGESYTPNDAERYKEKYKDYARKVKRL